MPASAAEPGGPTPGSRGLTPGLRGSPPRLLSGRRVVICRPAIDAEPLVELLRENRATPIRAPLQRRAEPGDGGQALRSALARIDAYDWLIVTSVNAVRAIAEARPNHVRSPGPKVAAVGPATASALSAIGLKPDLVPERATAAALAECFMTAPPGERSPEILVPLGQLADDSLTDGLQAKGYDVHRVEAYRMVETEPDTAVALAVSGADTVIFSAPSAVDAFLARFGPPDPSMLIVCIGPRTAARVAARGLNSPLVAAVHSDRGVLDALLAASGDNSR